MSDEPTRTKTLWSETQLEMLYLALERDRPDAQIIEIVRDLVSRSLPPAYLYQKVAKQVGQPAADRMHEVMRTRKKN